MCTQQLGCRNVAIGHCVQVPTITTGCQLAIGFDNNCYWLTGCANRDIRVHANLIDSAGNAGAAPTACNCQVLTSTGTGLVWATVCRSPLQVSGVVRGFAVANITTNSIQIDDLYFALWGGNKSFVIATSNNCNNDLIMYSSYQVTGGTGIYNRRFTFGSCSWSYIGNDWQFGGAGDQQRATIQIACASNVSCLLCAYSFLGTIGHSYCMNPVCVTRIF
jgi:hypothetical protein